MNASLFTNSTVGSESNTRARAVCTRGSLIALLLSACGNAGSEGTTPAQSLDPVAPSTVAPNAGTGITASTAGAENTTDAIPTVVTPTSVILIETQDIGPNFCEQPNVEHPIFENLRVAVTSPTFSGTNVFYSWTTAEQAAELAASGPLLSRAERPGKGPGFAREYLASFVTAEPEQQDLVTLLLSEPFAKARFAWPHAWATRMGWPATADQPAENYGNQLLRITVRAGALWAVVSGGQLYVVDETGLVAPTSEALTNPERIVGLYFQKDANVGGASCGTFGQRSDSGFREFILMNPDMIESWSLGTEQIREVVNTDLERLRNFFQSVRSCPITTTEEQWAGDVVCSAWNRNLTEVGAYEMTLALMNAYYMPRPAEIAAIIATLEADSEAWDVVIAETTVTTGATSTALTSATTESAIASETLVTSEPSSTQETATSTAVTTSTAITTNTAVTTSSAPETGATSAP